MAVLGRVRRRAPYAMSDRAVVVLAVAAAAGALAARPLSVSIGAGVIAGAFVLRRPAVLCVGVALLASALAARSWAGLSPPAARSIDGVVTLVGDPADAVGRAVKADVRVEGGRRVELWARGDAADALRDRLAGERVAIRGRLGPLPHRVRRWLAPRHVSGRISADRITTVAGTRGSRFTRIVNGLRRALARGASSLPADRRPLFTGLVIGDDRGQRPEIVDDFRASGLSHLLVVSGENVAFVLTLAGLALRRLSLGWRLVLGLAVLATFGTLTRWEPSVLRAVAMASIALVAAVAGRPQPGVRVLALAVTGLLLVDPLLVHAVGFRLSVAASAGILLLAAPLARRLPGPRWFAAATSVTLAAQVGVAPVLVPTFGALPAASLPANLLAVPAAGPVVVWGMSAGLVAGVVGGAPAALLHVPTRLLVAWIAGVARVTAALPLARLGGVTLTILAGAIAAAVVCRRSAGRLAAALAVAVAVVALPVWRPPPTALGGTTVAPGVRVWRGGDPPSTVVVVDAGTDPLDALGALRARGIGRIDVLAVRGTSDAIGAIRARHHVGYELDARTTAPGTAVRAGTFEIEVRDPRTARVVVRAVPGSGGRHRADGLPAASHASTAAVGSRPRSPRPFHWSCCLAQARHAARSSVLSSSDAAGARLRPPLARPPPAPDAPMRPSSRPAPLNRTICASNSSRWARHRSSSHRRPSKPNSTVCSAPISSLSWRSQVRTIDTFFAIAAKNYQINGLMRKPGDITMPGANTSRPKSGGYSKTGRSGIPDDAPPSPGRTASTWWSCVRPASKFTADAAMYRRQMRARASPTSATHSAQWASRFATHARSVSG
jgi:competence protein ComEC